MRGRHRANVLQARARLVIHRAQVLRHRPLRFPGFAHFLIRAQQQGKAFGAQFGPRVHQVAPHVRRLRQLPSFQIDAREIEARPRGLGIYRALPGIGFLGGLHLALALEDPPEHIQQLGVIRMGFDGRFQCVCCALFAAEQPGDGAGDPRGSIAWPKREGLIASRDGLIPSLASDVGQPDAIVGFGRCAARVSRVAKRLLCMGYVARKQMGIPPRGSARQIAAVFFEEGVDHLQGGSRHRRIGRHLSRRVARIDAFCQFFFPPQSREECPIQVGRRAKAEQGIVIGPRQEWIAIHPKPVEKRGSLCPSQSRIRGVRASEPL